MKTKSGVFTKALISISVDVREEILKELERIKNVFIDGSNDDEVIFEGDLVLLSPVMFAYIDDQFSEVIGEINTNGRLVKIDNQDTVYDFRIDELTSDQLIAILGELESITEFEQIELL